MRIGSLAVFEGGVDVRALVVPADRMLADKRPRWKFRMWLLLAAGQWGIAPVRNIGAEPSPREISERYL